MATLDEHVEIIAARITSIDATLTALNTSLQTLTTAIQDLQYNNEILDLGEIRLVFSGKAGKTLSLEGT